MIGALMIGTCSSAVAEEPYPDKALHIYAVQVLKTRLFQHWELAGIYLGNGGVLTAAHVVGRWHFLKDLRIRIAGQDLPATIIKEGESEQTDLTVMSVDAGRLPVSLRLRRNPICKEPLRLNQEVIVVFPQGTAPSRILSSQVIPTQYRNRFGTIISDVPLDGSGSGVFDANKRCLLGIISRQITGSVPKNKGPVRLHQYAKYFVPAATIAKFLPEQFRF